MSRRFGRLPPLTALEGFESAARLKSFSLAAEELNITQSAVSHQIRALEEFFGLALFNRVGRSVVLGTTSAFASKWLLPRYDKLKQWFPEVQPWLYTCNDVYELAAQEVDLAIWYGNGEWPVRA